jgi:hypothetical protein
MTYIWPDEPEISRRNNANTRIERNETEMHTRTELVSLSRGDGVRGSAGTTVV